MQFFLESGNTPEHVINVLTHGGWCMSMVSTANIIRSLTKEHHDIIKDLGRDGLCALAYNNLDFDFKVKESTLENLGTFSSITTGMFIPLGHGTMLDDIHYSRELWERSSLNPQGPRDISPAQPPSQKYLMKQVAESFSQIESVIQWFIKSIVVNDFLSPEYCELLGPIPSSKYIPVKKSIQQPAHVMHVKASSTDGNVEIIENLENQLGTSKGWYNEYV